MTALKKIKLLLLCSFNVWILIQLSSCNTSTDSDSAKSKVTHNISVSGGTFRMILHQPHSLDPLFVTTTYECCITEQIFNGLVKFDANLSPVPDLVESWSFSEDKTTITFQLKKGVRFHNGRELVAQDVIYSFNRIFDPSLQVPLTIKKLLQSIDGTYQFQTGATDSISGFVIVDDYTFQIRLVKPNSSILKLLAVNYFKVIPEEEFSSVQSFSKNPVGTGPFKFDCWKTQQAIILTKNENCFNGKAYLDSIIFIISERERESELFDKFCDEKLDILNVSNRLDMNALPENKYYMLNRLKLGFSYIGFNLQAPLLKELEMRQAIAYAINREAIISHNNETYKIANGLFPAGMPGYQPRQKCYSFNPQKAKKLLLKLNSGRMDKLQCWTIISDTSKKYLEIIKIIQQNLNDVGIEIEVKAVNYHKLVTTIKNGDAPMFVIALVAEIPLPEEFLANTFSTSGGNNFFNYHNPEVDMLIDSSKHEFDFANKIKLLQLVEKKIINDVPIIPLFYTSNAYLIQNYVHGIEIGPLGIANIPMEKIWKEKI